MSKQLTDTLIKLSKADREMNEIVSERDQILESRDHLQKAVDKCQNELEGCQVRLDARHVQQEEESIRLKTEEMRLVEQRKQLTTLGSKSAKLVERQIELASQTLQQMEEKAVKAIEEVEVLENERDGLRDNLEELNTRLKGEEEANGERLDAIEKEIEKLDKERGGALGKLDDRLKKLYSRVHVRYPESAIAIAQKGSCRSCYRSLPSQLYNQLMSGSMSIQCPDCNRLLVYVAEDTAAG